MYSTPSMKGIQRLQERCPISRYKEEETNLYSKGIMSVLCIPICMAMTGEYAWIHMVQWFCAWALFSSWLDTVLVLLLFFLGGEGLTLSEPYILLCKTELLTTPASSHCYIENKTKYSGSSVTQSELRVHLLLIFFSEWTDLQEQI